MPSLNIMSLFTPAASQANGGVNTGAGEAAQAEGIAGAEFAPVLNEQVQQLQGQATVKNVIAAPVPGLLAAFLQRLSVVATDGTAQGEVSQEGGEQSKGQDIQLLIGRILDLLQSPVAINQSGEENPQIGISVKTLTELQPEQVESLATLLSVPVADIKIALEKIVKEYLAAGSEFIIPASANDENEFYSAVQEGTIRQKRKNIEVSQTDAVVPALVNPLSSPLVNPLANTAAIPQPSLTGLAAIPQKSLPQKVEQIIPLTEEERAQLLQSAPSATTGVLSSGSVSSEADPENKTSGEITNSSSGTAATLAPGQGFGVPLIEPLTTVIQGADTIDDQQITQAMATLTALRAPEFKSGFQGVAAESVEIVSNTPGISTAVATEIKDAVRTKTKTGIIPTPKNTEMEDISTEKSVAFSAHANKDISARFTQTPSKAEQRIEAEFNDFNPLEPNVALGFVAEETLTGRSFSESESDARDIVEITQDIAGIKEAPAAAARKVIAGLPRNQVAPPTPVAEQVMVKIRDVANHDGKQIQIHLDPKDLGKVDVRMEVGTDGRTQITMTVDKKETLDLLQRDRVSLEKALGELGLKTDSGSMNFNLREQPRGQQQLADQNMQQGGGRGWTGEPLPEELREDVQPTQPYRSGYILRIDEGVNISV